MNTKTKRRKGKKLTDKEKWRIWRQRVFKRDRFTCQLCGQRGGYIEPHHIKRKFDYPKLRYNVHNGITLCGRCHKMVTGYEDEWVDVLNKIKKKKLTLKVWNTFWQNMSSALKTQVKKLKREKIYEHIKNRIAGWKQRQKKSRIQ